MRRLMVCLAGVLLAAGCSSSGGGGSPAGCDATCRSSVDVSNRSYFASVSAAAGSESSAAAVGSPITANYDTATCADWVATGAEDRLTAAMYYAVEYGDPQADQDGGDMVQIITTTCAAYGVKETPSHVAKVSIATVYGH
jgi:hypothetical protein